MRYPIVSLVVLHAAAGYDVIVACAGYAPAKIAHEQCVSLLTSKKVPFSRSSSSSLTINLERDGAQIRFCDVSVPSGAALIPVPVLVLNDVSGCPSNIVADIRLATMRFPDGTPPIIIEC